MNKKLTDIISEVMAVPTSRISAAMTFDDLGCDSLDKMDILMRCEDAFGVSFTMRKYDSTQNMGELERLLSGEKT